MFLETQKAVVILEMDFTGKIFSPKSFKDSRFLSSKWSGMNPKSI